MKFLLVLCMLTAFVSSAELTIVNGQRIVCDGDVCRLVEEREEAGSELTAGTVPAPRIAQGYMTESDFAAFLASRTNDGILSRGEVGLWVILLLTLLGGLAMNLTPCVLPLVPVNLMIIGRSAWRGTAYGLGIAVAYGVLGAASALGGMAFGAIQGNPWFNAAVSAVFVLLALAMLEVLFIDFSRMRPKATGFPFLMGAFSAVLAGACVAPILISVLVLTADLTARGHQFAVLLPFVMGLGMALPWPLAGAGLNALPKPGAWMKWVNRGFGVVVLGFAAWYGYLAWLGFHPETSRESRSIMVGDLSAQLAATKRPVLVDCWATWCKNCAAMDRVMSKPSVRKALEAFTVIRVQTEDIGELRKIPGFEAVRGLPAFAVFE